MAVNGDDLNRLIELTYAGVEDGAQWSALLTQLARALHAERVEVESEPDPGRAPMSGVRSATGFRFEDDASDPRMLRCALVSCGEATTLTVRWTAAGPAGSARAVRLCRALLPHLARARHLHRRVSAVEAGREAAEAVLEFLPLGIVLLGPDGRVVGLNCRAADLLDRRDGLTIAGGRLSAHPAAVDAELRRLCGMAGSGGVLSIRRRSCVQPLSLTVVPLGAAPGADRRCERPAAVAFLGDPDVKLRPLSGVLATLYGLTPREASIVARLVDGETVADISRSLDVTLNTVRTHLKRAYSKTGTSGQSSLLRLVLLGVSLAQCHPIAGRRSRAA
ncbi:MAG: helix-turn-helix transcriptional regulator [Myxococcales bacterium]|jgi:DNA-binding CsgD family transcriptional regulator|nr:helix-turn-helix transcriptional regulator [Myxococcales bacterium]